VRPPRLGRMRCAASPPLRIVVGARASAGSKQMCTPAPTHPATAGKKGNATAGANLCPEADLSRLKVDRAKLLEKIKAGKALGDNEWVCVRLGLVARGAPAAPWPLRIVVGARASAGSKQMCTPAPTPGNGRQEGQCFARRHPLPGRRPVTPQGRPRQAAREDQGGQGAGRQRVGVRPPRLHGTQYAAHFQPYLCASAWPAPCSLPLHWRRAGNSDGVSSSNLQFYSPHMFEHRSTLMPHLSFLSTLCLPRPPQPCTHRLRSCAEDRIFVTKAHKKASELKRKRDGVQGLLDATVDAAARDALQCRARNLDAAITHHSSTASGFNCEHGVQRSRCQQCSAAGHDWHRACKRYCNHGVLGDHEACYIGGVLHCGTDTRRKHLPQHVKLDSDELSSIPLQPCAWPVGSTCEVLVLCLEPPCLSAFLI